jgi:hypothetical protein
MHRLAHLLVLLSYWVLHSLRLVYASAGSLFLGVFKRLGCHSYELQQQRSFACSSHSSRSWYDIWGMLLPVTLLPILHIVVAALIRENKRLRSRETERDYRKEGK